ncbi:hypothetical protein BOSP111201_09065 [Bordetella sputigena]|uniref:hypothetical protein n=1 Tax=Bordetella sputigena TaxID=1416810 RepID=UPI0039F0038F
MFSTTASACTSQTRFPPDDFDTHGTLPPAAPSGPSWQPGWIVSYPLGRGGPSVPGPAAAGQAAFGRGLALELHVADDIRRNEEPLMEALAIIGTTMTGEMLLTDLSRKLGHRPIRITRATRPQQAGLSADPRGGLRMALYPDTLLSRGASMQAHGGREPFSAREQYACGLFEFLLCAMNHFECGAMAPSDRLHLHPETMAFRQSLLDIMRHAPIATAEKSTQNGHAHVGLRFELNDNMAPYRDGFHRALVTLRGIPLGCQLLKDLADVIAGHTLHVYHVDLARDAGVLLGLDASVHWYYNVGAATAHGALLQVTDDDLTQEQREACAAFDILRKSWESLQRDHNVAAPRVEPGQRLDLDLARRAFRDNLMDDHRGYLGAAIAVHEDRVRV